MSNFSSKVYKDLNSIETKFLFNLTKRQFFFTFTGAILGIVTYFAAKNKLDTNVALILMIIVFSPFTIIGFAKFQKKGIEVFLYQYFRRILGYTLKIYKRKNNYELLYKRIERENIIRKNELNELRKGGKIEKEKKQKNATSKTI